MLEFCKFVLQCLKVKKNNFSMVLDMSDTSDPNSDDKAKCFHINKKGCHCIPCKLKRQSYHKESKTVKKDGKITSNIVEDRRNF